MNEKEIEVLEIIEHNGRQSIDTIAKMIDLSVEETAEIIKHLEDKKVIVEYAAVIDWAKVEGDSTIKAMIDVKVTPKREVGFDEIARRIYRYDEVKSVYLMSGAYDLSVTVEGKSMAQVAQFVSEKLSTLDSVLSTTTHFIMKQYKHDGTIFDEGDSDKRIVVSP
ncbi:Lrp/AsnC family transcriptional regulator [Bacillaceae bacterium SIJ1]|uniref:Lrp/AsnC family transcriptional regulator n=1 Tax=Litoribacterium kuwaitense TaxID=1398745 RepID=UPI0013EDEBB6|nr:Lrp/AsnC family transcriptional regulator [Litoribacterium kuwaitense]NGP44294.1 Lrp/AsnC family transcriptional regulator [Litoribacterium kuwaitense]